MISNLAKLIMHPPCATSFGRQPIVGGLLRVSLQAGGLNDWFRRDADLFKQIKESQRRCSQRQRVRFKRIQIQAAERTAFLRVYARLSSPDGGFGMHLRGRSSDRAG